MRKNSLKIGVLDSGRGGLSVVSDIVNSKKVSIADGGVINLDSIKECETFESKYISGFWEFIYLADNANLPYGVKTSEEICRLTQRALRFFDAHKIDVLIIACNTICAHMSEFFLEYPVLKVIDSNIASLKELDKSSKIALFATKSTIDSKIYPKCFVDLGFLSFYEISASELVEMIESEDTLGVQRTLLSYRENLSGVDFLLLGCTHFPLIKDAFLDVFGGQILNQSTHIFEQLAFSASLPLSYTLTLYSTSYKSHPGLLDFASRVF